MSYVRVGKDEIKRATYLTYFFFYELGFQSDFLETELFLSLNGSKEVERVLQIMKKSGWEFQNKSLVLSVWLWKKPRRRDATLYCVPPNFFVLVLNCFCWGYDLQSESIPSRTVSEKGWEEIETEAMYTMDKSDRKR